MKSVWVMEVAIHLCIQGGKLILGKLSWADVMNVLSWFYALAVTVLKFLRRSLTFVFCTGPHKSRSLAGPHGKITEPSRVRGPQCWG
jgi:hypothetical protein